MTIESPQSFVVREECQKAASQNGFRRILGEDAGWAAFGSTTAKGTIYLAATGPSGPWYLALDHLGVIRELNVPEVDISGPGRARLIFDTLSTLAERRVAEVCGWHRSFCLSMAVGRGTPDEPGLVLGLDRGGVCEGVAYRIAERDIASELPILWSREMLIGGYNPTWVDVIGDDGEKFGVAIAFTIDRAHDNYAGSLPQYEKVRRLATAEGSWGSSADYLFRTIGGLREHGIRDMEMERLGDLVDAASFEELGEAA